MKTFLSIGAGPGIGFSTAALFASEGYKVVLAGRSRAKLEELSARLERGGKEAVTLVLDAGDLDAVRDAVRRVAQDHGGIDVLHYNAAALRQATIEEQPPETLLTDLAANIGGALAAIKAVEPIMAAKGAGTILLTGGGLALRPNPQYLLLGIGKAAIRNMAHALFEPFKAKNIHVASLTISAYVQPDSPAATAIAERFWDLHAAGPNDWVPEATYPG